MTITPPFSLQFCRAIAGVIKTFCEVKGLSTSTLSRQIFTHSDGLKTVLNWQGVGRAPTLSTIQQIEEHIRVNFDDDADRSETLYQEALDRELTKQRETIEA